LGIFLGLVKFCFWQKPSLQHD